MPIEVVFSPVLAKWLATDGPRVLAVSTTRKGLEIELGAPIAETISEVFSGAGDALVDPSELLVADPRDLPWVAE